MLVPTTFETSTQHVLIYTVHCKHHVCTQDKLHDTVSSSYTVRQTRLYAFHVLQVTPTRLLLRRL